jgi:outer membrane protein assembly factor BamB
MYNPMKRRCAQVASIVLATCLTHEVTAGQDWPQWRGPTRDGTAASLAEVDAWPERLTLRWKVRVGGGYASPVVSEGRVYLHAREEDQEVVQVVDLATGKEIWRDRYPAAYTMHPAAVSAGKGPKSTPVVANGKLYTLGISGVLSCYQAKIGKLVWRTDTGRQFDDLPPEFGMSVSPIADGGLLIVHLGNNKTGAVTAFDAATGKERWRWSGDSPSYASPVLATLGGIRQVVDLSYRALNGLSIETGALLWQIPYKATMNPHAATPAVYGSTVIVSGAQMGTTAFSVTRTGNEWSTKEAWHNPDASMSINSPVVRGHLLFGLSDRNRGQFFCLDADTGAAVWTSPGRNAETAAILKAGGHLLLFTTDGGLTVVRGDDTGYAPLRRYQVAEGSTWTIPAVIGHRLLVRDAEHLMLWEFPQPASKD